MSTNLRQIGIDCGLVVMSVIGLAFILNRLGFHAWVWWVSRGKHKAHDPAAEKYWSAHE
jgi:hypothetical protein